MTTIEYLALPGYKRVFYKFIAFLRRSLIGLVFFSRRKYRIFSLEFIEKLQDYW